MKFGPSVNLTTALEQRIILGERPPFNPATDLPYVHMNIDASSISGVSEGNPVSTWSTIAPGSYGDLTQSGVSRPTYLTVGIDSKPSVRFTSTESMSLVNGGLGVAGWISEYTIFAIFENDRVNPNINTGIISYAPGPDLPGGSTGPAILSNTLHANSIFALAGDAGGTSLEETSAPGNGNPMLVVARLSGGNFYLQINDNTELSTTCGNVEADSVVIGGGSIIPLQGLISRITVCVGPLSWGDRYEMRQWCRTNWNLW